MDTIYMEIRKVDGGFILVSPLNDGCEQVVTSLSKVLKVVRQVFEDNGVEVTEE